jgi:hypothetical protein
VVKALPYKTGGRGFDFSIYLILPAALGPGIYSACNRNEYQKQKNNVSGNRARPVRRDDWPPRPVTGIAFTSYLALQDRLTIQAQKQLINLQTTRVKSFSTLRKRVSNKSRTY